ncbi:NF-kappa-B inhibitor alpha-like [Synchiropus splendidus]|uniref:NF-kappa-B inhibitor alpha-like n=1 Tax=Synchiropus splendidus TaxID=270530 RepID=UPI00237D8532|nr:NF-kappa-B inhibitor alpha-like [Synchiropus splendidus]
MDVQRRSHHSQMDYNREPKPGKTLPCHEERFDSGLDSLKEDELERDFAEVSIRDDASPCEHEPWRSVVTDDGDTLLHLAVIHEATEHALHMIKRSPNCPYLNVQNHQRQTALHLAVITEQPLLVDSLLKAGADPRLTDDGGNTALHIACKKGSLACFANITQNGSSRHLTSLISSTNYNGHNCLHIASINGFISLVESLVRLGADINAQEQCSGRTALHLAVDLQNPALVRRLLDLGADVNCLNYGGFTPYHLTYGRQNDEIRHQLYQKTAQELRELPESESDDSDMEDMDASEDEMYDDIKFGK